MHVKKWRCFSAIWGASPMAQQYRIRPQYRRHRREGLTPGLGKSPGGGNGNALQYSCLENPMERGAWRGTVAKSRTRLHTQHTLRLGFLPFWCQKGICWTLVQDQFQGRWSQSVSADSDRTRADSKFLKNSLSPHYYSDPLVLSIGVVKALKKKKKGKLGQWRQVTSGDLFIFLNKVFP